MAKEKKVTRYRDAGNGQYTTKKDADKRPGQTVKETDKVKKAAPKKK